MDIRSCRICGKLFQSLGDKICPECAEELDRCFIKVRDYLYAHKNADVLEISKETGVKEKYILDFLREERLTLASAAGTYLKCEQCGSPIETGRLCERCKDALSEKLRVEPAKRDTPVRQEKTQATGGKWGRLYVDYRK